MPFLETESSMWIWVAQEGAHPQLPSAAGGGGIGPATWLASEELTCRMRQVQTAGLSSEPSRVQGSADMVGAEGPAGWDAGVASRASSTSLLGGDSQVVLRTVSPVSKVLRLAKSWVRAFTL